VLHAAAAELIECLTTRYVVERVDRTDLDGVAASAWPGSPATHLEPQDGGAPIVFTFTPFPGIMVRFGYGGWGSYPACGCDICSEDPGEEAERMRYVVGDVVAGGFFETRVRRRWRDDTYESRLVSRTRDGFTTQRGDIDPDTAARMPHGTTRWPTWTTRSG
jgi:hypothetical protein